MGNAEGGRDAGGERNTPVHTISRRSPQTVPLVDSPDGIAG